LRGLGRSRGAVVFAIRGWCPVNVLFTLKTFREKRLVNFVYFNRTGLYPNVMFNA
jgi:hypothetical protein